MLKLQRSSAIEVYLRKAVLSLGLFCTIALLSAVLYSSIGVSGELNQATFADSSNSTSTISLRITKDGNDVTGLNLDLSPTATGAFVKDNLSLLVTTDNATGYKLDFSNTDDDTAMTHTSPATTASIPSITTTTDESSFPVNSWGYSIDAIAGAQTFSPIPTKSNSTTLKTTTAPSTNDQTDITFAIKADTNMPSGTYKDTVVFTAVANYVPNALEQISNMQDMTPQVCDAANVGDTATLKDTRDNKTYVIRKLADGNCWMVQNLALGGSQAITLTPQDSNVSANFTLDPSSDSFGTTNDAAGININRMHDNGNTWIDSGNTVQTSGTPPSQTQYMGNYYNWYTATAGSGTYAMGTQGDNALQSICPKGWRLPTGGAITSAGNGEFQKLYNAYGNYNDFISATSAALSGFWVDSSASGQGSYGHWWSRTANSTNNGYYLYFYISSVAPQNYYSKRVGSSVRCVAVGAFNDISTMQEMTPDICSAATVGDRKILHDTRDGNTYTVRKMEDNKCWMTQNLRLGSTSAAVTLTSADSNVSSNFTIPASAVQTSGNTAWGYDEVRVYNNGNAWIAPTSVGNNATVNTTGTPPNQSQYVGNYYNWYTATAGSGTYAVNINGQNAAQSICPKGWRLPTGGPNSDFTNLTSALVGIATNTNPASDASFTLQSTPYYFVLAGGYYNGDGASRQGYGARLYSSTAHSSGWVYSMGPNITAVHPQGEDGKNAGRSVRCVAENQDLTTISTMQQMTPSICAATRTPGATETTVPEKTLTDTRDNQTYLVRKLADGNCWMSQNLNLTLSTSTALNSTTSDLSPGRTWTPQNSTQTTVGTVWAQGGSDGARSFEPGEALYFPGGAGTGTADSYANLTGSTSGQPWEHVGNYYNWYAATAGTGTAAMTDGNTATDSICPKGWKLPDNTGSKSFLNLVATTYGITDDATGATKLLQAPLNFVRAGYYLWSNGQVYDKGAGGYWWPTAAQSATNAYGLGTNSTRVIPQNAYSKGHGFTVRCVAH